MNAQRGMRRRLTRVGWSPAWSPDGTRIAFVHRGEIRVVDVDGGGTTIAAKSPQQWYTSPTWSADATEIAFGCERERGDYIVYTICVARADGSGGTRTIGVVGAENPAWSPNGSSLAFDRSLGGIFVSGLDGRRTRNIASGYVAQGLIFAAPSWSPEGKHIVFGVGDDDRASGLIIVDVRSRRTKPLTRAGSIHRGTNPFVGHVFIHDARPDWSPGGQWIAFERTRGSTPLP